MNEHIKQDKEINRITKATLGSDLDDLDYFKDINYVEPKIKNEPHKKKHFKFSRFQMIASFMISLLLLSSVFAVLISNGSVSATKFKIEQQIVNIKNQFTGANLEFETKVEGDSIVVEIKTLDEIDKAADFFPELFIAKNIPDRYRLESLSITKNIDGTFNALYIFMTEAQQLLTINQISVSTDSSVSFVNISKEIETDKGTIYISENPFGDGANSSSYLTDAFIINVSGMISLEEMLPMLAD